MGNLNNRVTTTEKFDDVGIKQCIDRDIRTPTDIYTRLVYRVVNSHLAISQE